MGFGADSYRKMLLSLLPSGLAWPKESGSELYKQMDAFAQELARVDARAMRLLEEADPRTTFELITDWERIVGLPDECTPSTQTLQQRREAIVSKLAFVGGISRQFYIDLAAKLGFTITITEFRPFRAGISKAGDALTNGPWVFAWQVNAHTETVRYFVAGAGSAGEPLATWGNDALECVISKYAPAGTIVLFSYG